MSKADLKFSLMLAVPALAVLCSAGHAQIASSDLVGTVLDSTGGVMQGAKVTATNADTNISRSTLSNDSGIYDLTGLPPGHYTLDVEKPGFQHTKIEDIVLEVGQKARVNVTLRVGEVSQVVDVKGEAPLVDTETPEVGSVMAGEAIVQLPLNGRNFEQLATLQAGVNKSNEVQSPSGGIMKAPSPTGGGLGATGDSFNLDGAANKEMWYMAYNVVPPIDSIEEFKVEVGLYSAANGFGGATIINVVTKSGTNQFHGSMWDFLRNNHLDGANFFAPLINGKRVTPKLTRNQYGFTFGGPIRKNRTFFFGTYEGTRDREGLSYTTRLPTQAERDGDLSNYIAVTKAAIVDPTTKMPFGNNVIPPSRLDTISKALINAIFPLPNNPTDFFRNYVTAPSARNDSDNFSARVDHNFSDRERLFGRWSLTKPTGYTPGANSSGLTAAGGQGLNSNWQNVTIGLTSSLSPTLTNDLRLAYNRSIDLDEGQDVGDLLTRIGLKPPLGRTGGGPSGIPSIGMQKTSMITSVTNIFRFDSANWNYPIRDDMTWVHGTHTVQFGGEYMRALSWGLSDTSPSSVSFSGAYSGDGFSDLLLGIPGSMSISFPPVYRIEPSQTSFAGYVQDAWKVSPRVTITLGVRYEVQLAPFEKRGLWAQWDPTLGNGVGGLLYPKQNPIVKDFYTNYRTDLPWGFLNTDNIFDTDANNWGPRVGIAFRPFGDTRTVMRTGYGIMYVTNPILQQGSGYATSPPEKLSGSITSDPSVPTLSWNSAYTGVIRDARIPGTPISATIKQERQNLNPYVQEWTFSLSRELSPGMVVTADYLGNKGSKIWIGYDEQYALNGPGPGALQNRVPFPKWSSIYGYHNGGSSNYEGLMLSAERRFKGGLSFRTNYTWSHSMAANGAWGRLGFLSWVQNRFAKEVGPTGDDVRHLFSSFVVWDLPFGPGKPVANVKGPLGQVIGGWQVTSIVTGHTGFPMFTNVAASFCNVSLSGFCYPNVTGTRDQYTIGGNGVDRPRYDRTYFPPPNFTYGNAGLFPVRQNSTYNVDFGVYKHFSFTERYRLEFRAEAFNFFNHPYFPALNARPDTASFARATTAADPRKVQFALKFRF